METGCVGSDPRSLLMERYPEIFFLLTYIPFQPCPHKALLDEKTSSSLTSARLSQVDVLYIYGIGQGSSYRDVRDWLHAKKERMLIYLEDDLGALDALLQNEIASEMIRNPQVHLHFVNNRDEWEPSLKTLLETFPSHRIEVAYLESYEKKSPRLCKKIHLTLMRQCAVVHALMTEALYSHHLVENVLANIKRWPHSFFANRLKNKFRGIPAVICGAGPSLGPAIPFLRQLEDRALIIAGGSTISALSNQGIIPHLGLALDPNPEEYDRLRVTSAFEMPLLYGTRLQPDVFNTSNGPWGYLHSYTGGPCEAYFERELGIQAEPVGPDLGPEAFSVTTLAIALAVEMGCSPILLSGIDLAYTGMQRYADGVMPSSQVFLQELKQETRASERILKRKGIQGTMVYTLVKWVMESSSIANYAKAHPEATFINVSSQGLGFKGIPNDSFAEVIEAKCHRTYDLRAMVHHHVAQYNFSELTPAAVSDHMKALTASLSKLSTLCDQMLDELNTFRKRGYSDAHSFPSGKMTLLQLDMEEEQAFDCFLPHVGPMLDRLLNRSHAIPPFGEPEAIQAKTVARLITKWEHLKTMIEKEKETLKACTSAP
jgi:hypothetical protein